MSFKNNLKQKIEIDRLARQVLDSLEPGESGAHLDKEAVRTILQTAGYEPRAERDLELFSRDFDADPAEIIVLDNELPLFRTSTADVVLRRSPYLKEMISIRNAIRILNDKDVVAARRTDTVMKIRRQCVMQLDLRYNRADIESIYENGINALKNKDSEAAAEALTLLAEILALQSAPSTPHLRDFLIFGRRTTDETGVPAFGSPMIIFNRGECELGLIKDAIAGSARPKPAAFRKYLSGEIHFALEGTGVFEHLRDRVLADPPDAGALETFKYP